MTSLVGRAYRHRYAPLVAFLFVVALGAFGLWRVEQQQQGLRAEVEARALASCEGTVEGRAVVVVFGDALVAAANSQPDRTAEQIRRAEAFRDQVRDAMAGRPPPACEGIMTSHGYAQRVDAAVARFADAPE